jgi:hypothetical protein
MGIAATTGGIDTPKPPDPAWQRLADLAAIRADRARIVALRETSRYKLQPHYRYGLEQFDAILERREIELEEAAPS